MNPACEAICDIIPDLKSRFSNILYDYRPKKYDYKDAAWTKDDLRDGQKIGEFVVAEITTLSTPSSTTTVYGRKVDKGICYRIADEYDVEIEYCTMMAPVPLSLEELIDFIDGAEVKDEISVRGLAIYYTVYNYRLLLEEMYRPSYEIIEALLEELSGFTIVESTYYDELGSHYDSIFCNWATEALEEWAVPISGYDCERLFELIERRDSGLSDRLKAKYGDDVNNCHFYSLLNCEEANKVDYLFDFANWGEVTAETKSKYKKKRGRGKMKNGTKTPKP
jgi:hypothetical protein